MRVIVLPLLLGLVACGAPGGDEDGDGDGVGAGQDCNDKDPEIHPGAAERCDGVDNDCDGDIDEGVKITAYPDADLDGFGAIGAGQEVCEAQGGFVLDGTDCDDSDDTIYPGAVEDCSDVDRDCDGDPTRLSAEKELFYLDYDGDGYGVDTVTDYSCAPAPGFTAQPGDCNDHDATISPAVEELCNGIDDDCDTVIDDDPVDGGLWYPDPDGDGYGELGSSPTLACDPPPGTAPVGGDCDELDDSVYPGAPEICNGGIDDDCDATTIEGVGMVWHIDLDGDGYGDDLDTVIGGCTPPTGYTAQGGDCDDADPDIHPGLFPDCTWIHSGGIVADEVWPASLLHLVVGAVVVEGGNQPVLTIEDGALVVFELGTELVVGTAGALIVDGHTLGVAFTSAETTPAAGDWHGLKLEQAAGPSSLTGLLVEYAGGATFEGGVVIDGGDPVIVGLTSQLNLGNGLHISRGEPLVIDSWLLDNTGHGLEIEGGAGLSRADALGGSGPSFTDNVITGNLGAPIRLPGSHADEIDPSSVLSPNGLPLIELTAGTLRFTGTWYDHGLTYRVDPGARIDVEDGPQAALTIEDGVRIEFDIDSELRIGGTAEGSLILGGGPQGVIFTGTEDVITLSDNWRGLTFGRHDGGSLIEDLTIEYGGGDGQGNIKVDTSAPVFSNIISRYSDSSGLYVTGVGAAPGIRDSLFQGNDEDGVYVSSSSGLARSLAGPTFERNTLTGNGGSSVVLPPNFIGELDASTVFSGNAERIRVHGGTVLESAVWRLLDEDYQIEGTIQIAGPQDPVVEIDDNVTLWFGRDTELSVGIVDDGALRISGGTAGQVRMTSSDPAPGAGDWFGLIIGANSGPDRQTAIDGLLLEHAGGSDLGSGGALELRDVSGCSTKEPYVDLDNVEIRSSSKAALYAQSQTSFSADGFVMSGALGGCVDLSVPSGCKAPDIPSYTNNQCLDGSNFGTWPLARIELLDTTSTYPGPVLIGDRQLASSVTMPDLGVPYQFSELVEIRDESNPTLTVEPGIALTFEVDAGLRVGQGQPGGVVLSPGVSLSSAQAIPAPGDWDGLILSSQCSTVDIDSVTLEHGGSNANGALWINGCELGTVIDSTITDSSSCGIYVDDPTPPTVSISNPVFVDNAGGGLCVSP